MTRDQIPISNNSLEQLHKLNIHLSSAASKIDELGINSCDAQRISKQLKITHGITLWKLRDICDYLAKLEKIEYEKAEEFFKIKLIKSENNCET